MHSSPSVLWYITRGTGTVLLMCLTAVVVLGISAKARAKLGSRPQFVTHQLHRDIALFSVVLLAIHMVTAILDPFAKLGLKDALIPFASSYRPFWLGLGVVSGELIVALVLTSLFRVFLGYTVWKGLHWLAYLSWPIAVFHGLGTGSDAKQGWFLVITGMCICSVSMAVLWRLALTITAPKMKLIGGLAVPVFTLGLIVWAMQGPLAPNWTIRSGTPTSVLVKSAGSPAASGGNPGATPAPVLGANLDDPIAGTALQEANGTIQLSLHDTNQTALTMQIVIANPNEPTGEMTVTLGNTTLCQTTATLRRTGITATCGTTQLKIAQLQASQTGQMQGILATGGFVG